MVYNVKFHPDCVEGLDSDKSYIMTEYPEEMMNELKGKGLIGFCCEGKSFLVSDGPLVLD